MISDIETAVRALEEARVRYLIVGGVAVVMHGHLRTTADLDLVIQLDRENVLRAVRALGVLGYRPRAPVLAEALADARTREAWMRDKNLTVFSMWSQAHPTLELDLFVSEPFDFEDVYGRSLRVPLATTTASLIGLDDLIAVKRKVGRARDHEDVEALEALRAERESRGKDARG